MNHCQSIYTTDGTGVIPRRLLLCKKTETDSMGIIGLPSKIFRSKNCKLMGLVCALCKKLRAKTQQAQQEDNLLAVPVRLFSEILGF